MAVRWRRAATVIPAFLFLITACSNEWLMDRFVVTSTRAFSRDLESSLGEIGDWLAQYSPPDSVIATPDIGILGFRSGRKLLDLGGLIEPEVESLRARANDDTILKRGMYFDVPGLPNPGYIVDRAREPRRFAESIIRGRRFEPVLTRRIANLGLRQPGPYYYTLYRIVRVDRDKGARRVIDGRRPRSGLSEVRSFQGRSGCDR